MIAGSATAASARDLSLTISNGRVTIIAQDVTVRQILAEWARVGKVKVINGDKLIGAPLTLELRDVPEAKALETVLRTAAGYVVAPRLAGSIGPSSFDSVVILATSRAPAVSAAPPPPFTPNRQPITPPPVDDESDPNEMVVPPPGPGPTGQQFPGVPPNQNQPAVNVPQGPMTAPRPGQLPMAPGVGNPYQPTPQQQPPPPQTRPGIPTTPNRPGGGTGPGGADR